MSGKKRRQDRSFGEFKDASFYGEHLSVVQDSDGDLVLRLFDDTGRVSNAVYLDPNIGQALADAIVRACADSPKIILEEPDDDEADQPSVEETA